MKTVNLDSTILKKILKVGLSLLFLLPLLVVTGVLYPFVFPKVIFFQVVIELLLPVWLLYIWQNPQARPKLNLLNMSMAGFIFFLSLSTIFSIDPWYSFWGATEWHNGLFLYLHLAVFFLMLQIFNKNKDWLCFFRIIFVSSLIVGLSAWLQKAGMILNSKPRLVGLIGNASFLGAYLLFAVFSNFWLLLREKNLHFKIFIGFNIFSLIIILLMTESRAAILALIVAVLFSLMLYVFVQLNKKQRLIGFAGLLIFIILSIVFLQHNFSRYDEDWARSRNIQTRLISWQISWQAWQSKFFLGWGLENFYPAFNQYFNPEYLTYSVNGSLDYEAALNFAHNKIIDLGLSGGVFTVIFYLLIYVAAIFYLYKNNDNKEKFIVWSGFLAAHFINNLFLFDFILSFVGFFAVLAFCLTNKKNKFDHSEKTNILQILISLVLLIFIFTLVRVNVSAVKTSKLTNLAWENEEKANYELMIDNYTQALSRSDYVLEKTLQHCEPISAQLILNNAENQKVIDFYNKNLAVAKMYVKQHPNRLDALLQLAELYSSGRFLQADYLNESLAILKQAQQIAPSRPEVYIHLGQVYIYLDDKQKAIENFSKAVELNPKFYVSAVILGRAYEMWEDYDLMAQYYQMAIDSGYVGTTELNTLSQYYYDQQAWDKSLQIYNILHNRYPDNERINKKIDELSNK